ncbi:hypothetical protein M9Y10_042131 [Tritrichomonas musculus]|uniref:HNH nuclease domain-containing protein n=1 Tax=Tritrichomonas musculus TaxID=1915356 RepID=A0ABR2K6B5_9EUKA
MTEQAAEFVQLKDFDDYEILSVYPFTIRRKDNHYEVSEFISSKGYVKVHLNDKDFFKHRIIALQFIPNDDPEHKTQIDHKNRIRTDNHIENLFWCTQSTNQMNKGSSKGVIYEYVDEISDEATIINEYNQYQFENYFYHENKFYYYNGLSYRILHINEAKRNAYYVNLMNTEGKRVRIYINKFKKLYEVE